MRIAFQGERGAYSEEAAVQLFGEVEVHPCPRFADVFEAVRSGAADAGVIPIENSHTGAITDNHDLLRTHTALHVTRELKLRIRHNLLALPGVPLGQIRRAHSHVQALMQCERFLQQHGIEAVTDYDTAGAAKRVSEERLTEAGAIASVRAAAVYGLAVVQEGIETNPTNHTRFLAISREPAPRADSAKTSLVVALANVPGALHRALGVFASRQINLTRLESRPNRERSWEYLFYLDIEGHAQDPLVASALGELRVSGAEVRVFGSYPRGPA